MKRQEGVWVGRSDVYKRRMAASLMQQTLLSQQHPPENKGSGDSDIVHAKGM